ncbi:MAG: OmpA family protein [Solirubrobacterales bacterium]
MAESEGAKEEGAKGSPWADLLSAAGKQLMPVLLTAGSLIGFVAFAGGVIVWTRFSAAKVPPDQAVNAVPRDELVAIGSALLLLFGFFGVLALLGAFLIDRRARATPGMARGLLVVFLIEAVTAVVIFEGPSVVETIAAAELIALPVLAALWATFSKRFVSLEDDLPTREGVERPGPRRHEMFLLPGAVSWPLPGPAPVPSGKEVAKRALLLLGPILVALAGIIVAAVMVLCDAEALLLLVGMTVSIVAFLGFAVRLSWDEAWLMRDAIRIERSRAREQDEERATARAAGNPIDTAYHELRERRGGEDRWRLLNERPERLVVKGSGAIVMLILLLAAIGLTSWRLEAGWIAISIIAAALLFAALWRIATLSAERVIWYGVAIFLSVPLFGTLTAMARNVEDPQVQPMALIRTSDGPDEAIQGLYVTEADERVYFASVATEGCTEDLTAHSGRLEWVPKSEVVAMSVGPLQDIDDAAGTALEMAYALTPAAETPTGAESSFTAGELEAADSEEQVSLQPAAKRLEDTGPAVRPFYGSGLGLAPENASPGDRVTLTMNAPNEHDGVRGFGRTREGRTVRVGGVRATILKEYAHRADTAEYLETQQGQLLLLEKGGPYERSGGRFIQVGELDPDSEEELFLKLVDPKALSVGAQTMGEKEGEEGDAPGIYLRIERGDGTAPTLANPGQAVFLAGPVDGAGAAGAPIETRFYPRAKAQAWHERRISFVVPENASSGAVTVECTQLAGQPLLRVAHAPEARISVRMEARSSRVSFDGSRSSDADGERISQRWNIAGLRTGNRSEMAVDLPPRPQPYTVRMTVTDSSGRASVAEIQLLRLPASLFAVDEYKLGNEPVLEEVRGTLEEAVQDRLPAAIEIAGHADDPGTPRHNVHLSLRRAEAVREFLLHDPQVSVEGGARIQVRTLAYGEGCPTDPRPGLNRRNRRVDVFVVDHGVTIEPPASCHPRRLQSTKWRLPAVAPNDVVGPGD